MAAAAVGQPLKLGGAPPLTRGLPLTVNHLGSTWSFESCVAPHPCCGAGQTPVSLPSNRGAPTGGPPATRWLAHSSGKGPNSRLHTGYVNILGGGRDCGRWRGWGLLHRGAHVMSGAGAGGGAGLAALGCSYILACRSQKLCANNHLLACCCMQMQLKFAGRAAQPRVSCTLVTLPTCPLLKGDRPGRVSSKGPTAAVETHRIFKRTLRSP